MKANSLTERLRVIFGSFALLLTSALFIPLGAGCGEHDEPPGMSKKAIALDKIPASVTGVAKKTLPGVNLSDAWENLDKDGKLHSYEIRGRLPSNGKIREARISPDGKVLEVE